MYEMEERTDTHYSGGDRVGMTHPIWRNDRRERGEQAVFLSPGLVECSLRNECKNQKRYVRSYFLKHLFSHKTPKGSF